MVRITDFKNPFTGQTHSILDIRNLTLLVAGFAVWGILQRFGNKFAAQVDAWIAGVPLTGNGNGNGNNNKKREREEILA